MPVSENKWPPYWNSSSSLQCDLIVSILTYSSSLASRTASACQISSKSNQTFVVLIFQDGGYGIANLLPVVDISDDTNITRPKSICMPNFCEVSQYTADYYFWFPKKNKWLLYWNSALGLQSDHVRHFVMTPSII